MNYAVLTGFVAFVALSACTLEPLDNGALSNADALATEFGNTDELCSNGVVDDDETDVDCGGPCAPCGANAGCSCDSDCASGACIPTVEKINDARGRCWGESFGGCALIEYKPSAVKAMCGNRELVVCQRAANSQMQAHCAPPAVDAHPWDANVLCCDPEFL